MAKPLSYRMPSIAFSEAGYDSKYIPNHSHVERFSMLLTAAVTTDAAVARLRDGYFDQLIQLLTIKRGSTVYTKFRGMDWHWLHQLMQKEPHGLTQYTATGSLTADTTGSPVQLGIDVPVPMAPEQDRAEIEVTWASSAVLGAGAGDYTVTSASLNGQFVFAAQPPPAMRVLPFKGMNNASGTQNAVDVPVEGQVLGALVIARANASPNALRDPAGAIVAARIEGEQVFEVDFRAMKATYKEFCNLPSVQTGVGLLLFKDLPLVRGSSELVIDSDGTATDFNIYGVYTAGAGVVSQRETIQDVVRASGAIQAPARQTLASQSAVSRQVGGRAPVARALR